MASIPPLCPIPQPGPYGRQGFELPDILGEDGAIRRGSFHLQVSGMRGRLWLLERRETVCPIKITSARNTSTCCTFACQSAALYPFCTVLPASCWLWRCPWHTCCCSSRCVVPRVSRRS